jgi:hypothetical protein
MTQFKSNFILLTNKYQLEIVSDNNIPLCEKKAFPSPLEIYVSCTIHTLILRMNNSEKSILYMSEYIIQEQDYQIHTSPMQLRKK